MGKAWKDNNDKLKRNRRVSFQGWYTIGGVIANLHPYSTMALPIYFYCDAHWDVALYKAFATTCQHVAIP